MSNGKVIVAHPGRQHSYRLASAMKHADLLDEYITTIYWRGTYSLLGTIAAVAPGENGQRIRSRHNPDLNPKEVKQYYELRGIAEALMWRSKDASRYNRYMRRTSKKFGVAVAKEAIRRGASAVVCYDGQALDCFSYLKQHAPQCVRVMDVSIASRPYIRTIYEEIELRTGRNSLRVENPFIWDETADRRATDEIQSAQYYLAASDFVMEGLETLGAPRESILKLPYGCNFGFGDEWIRNIGDTSAITFLFVGQCVARKGLDVLADALEMGGLNDSRIVIAGKYDVNAPYMQRLLENPHADVLGLVSHDRVSQLCKEADVFVFPTCNEGMSLACLEAMGSGLPIITTPNSGVSELVMDEEAGYIVPCGDAEALNLRMRRFVENPDDVTRMGHEAYEVASKYTWDVYERRAELLFRDVILKK